MFFNYLFQNRLLAIYTLLVILLQRMQSLL